MNCARFSGETERSARETAVVAPGNGSIEDSSTQCSDVNDDDVEKEETDVEEDGWITNLPVSSTIVQLQPAFNTNGDIAVLPNANQPIFDNVRVQNSKNVRLVNKTCYNNCPVTQIVYTNPTPNQDVSKHDASSVCDNTSHLSTSKDNEAPNGCIFPQNTKLNKVTQWLWTWKWHMALLCVALILLGIIVFITVHLVTRDPDDASTTPTPNTPTTSNIPTSSPPGNNETEFRIVERDEWGAQPPGPLEKLKLPVSHVIICHTATAFCTTQSECANELRIIQDYQMKNDYADIAYNFMVGGDGLAYVGRSWNYTGGHSDPYKRLSIGIAFIGNFNSVVPPITQLNAAKELIKIGVENGKIARDYKLLGHRQVKPSTDSPGDALYNKIKKWPHWSSQPRL
ncbi:uncharacterized protein LOC143896670 isoform X2 [Temnothorax americanus]|uniref:uncharacterized protein LOC143896670 isoform X2 n=1 Tax=Temnothorax americanus TaxID=1964332 RepID=UPI00406791F9